MYLLSIYVKLANSLYHYFNSSFMSNIRILNNKYMGSNQCTEAICHFQHFFSHFILATIYGENGEKQVIFSTYGTVL